MEGHTNSRQDLRITQGHHTVQVRYEIAIYVRELIEMWCPK